MKFGKRNVIILGITGTIGSGKSLTGKILEELGVPVIDTDKIVHGLLASDLEIIKQIKEQFPISIKISSDGMPEEIERKKLAKIIFSDKEAKTKLERILHPRVREVCKQKTLDLVNELKAPPIIATLIPLLFESNRQSDYDQIWTIFCDENILRQRLAKRDKFLPEEIEQRLAGQFSQEEKKRLADQVLDNSLDETHLREQVIKNLNNLKPSLPTLNHDLST